MILWMVCFGLGEESLVEGRNNQGLWYVLHIVVVVMGLQNVTLFGDSSPGPLKWSTSLFVPTNPMILILKKEGGKLEIN